MSVLEKVLAEFEAEDAAKAAAAKAAAEKAENERRELVAKFRESRISAYLLNQAAELRAAGFDATVEHKDDRAYARLSFAATRKAYGAPATTNPCPYGLTFSAHEGHIGPQIKIHFARSSGNGFGFDAGFDENRGLPIEHKSLERYYERALRAAMTADRESEAKRNA